MFAWLNACTKLGVVPAVLAMADVFGGDNVVMGMRGAIERPSAVVEFAIVVANANGGGAIGGALCTGPLNWERTNCV